MDNEFCCKQMKNNIYCPALIDIGEYEEKNPSSIQRATFRDFPDEIHPVKKGEIYLYYDEISQIYGEPFKVCPWCGTKIEN